MLKSKVKCYTRPMKARSFLATRASQFKTSGKKKKKLKNAKSEDAYSKIKKQKGKSSKQADRESSREFAQKRIRESGRSSEVKVYKMDSFTSQDMA